jgi:hypothetical protein
MSMLGVVVMQDAVCLCVCVFFARSFVKTPRRRRRSRVRISSLIRLICKPKRQQHQPHHRDTAEFQNEPPVSADHRLLGCTSTFIRR